MADKPNQASVSKRACKLPPAPVKPSSTVTHLFETIGCACPLSGRLQPQPPAAPTLEEREAKIEEMKMELNSRITTIGLSGEKGWGGDVRTKFRRHCKSNYIYIGTGGKYNP